MTPFLATIGYAGCSPASLISSLAEAGVQTVLDVRIAPYSKSQPLFCRDALAKLVGDAGMVYLHDPNLGNPVREECERIESLDPYRAHLQAHADVLAPLWLLVTRGCRVALLCGCLYADRCHRGVIADLLAAKIPGLQVQHVRPPLGGDKGPSPKILGLTLHQPWAFAVAHCDKRVENRSWRPWCPVGTYIAVHAAKKIDKAVNRELRGRGIPIPATLPEMSIVAVARYARAVDSEADLPPGQATWWQGPIGWLLDDVVALKEPVPCKGAQGLWRVPKDVLSVVRTRWAAARTKGERP